MEDKYVAPKIGDYVKVIRVITNMDQHAFGKCFKVIEVDDYLDQNGNRDIKIEHNYQNNWYLVLSQVEVIPKEIAESSLFKLMKED